MFETRFLTGVTDKLDTVKIGVSQQLFFKKASDLLDHNTDGTKIVEILHQF